MRRYGVMEVSQVSKMCPGRQIDEPEMAKQSVTLDETMSLVGPNGQYYISQLLPQAVDISLN